MKLLLIRHADPDYTTDSITPLGHIQAEKLSSALSRIRLDEIYVSPFGRARETVKYTIDRINATAKILPWLAELDGNYRDNLWAWDCHGVDIAKGQQSISIDNWHDLVDYGDHILPVLNKLYKSFDEFIASHGYERTGKMYKMIHSSDKTIALFCHAGITLSLLSHLLNIPIPICYSQFGCDPSSVTTLEMTEKYSWATVKLLHLNDMSHCKGALSISEDPAVVQASK